MARGVITLITDFGTADGYVGAMKGVIASRAPSARVVDITHEIAPGDVEAAAFALRQAAPLFPPGTVHVVVVDPGVGSARRGIVGVGRGQRFVGPDNGLFAGVAERAFEIVARRFRRPSVSATFHGRDVFAPAAAALARGARPEAAGPEVPLTALPREPGRVVHVDRFGNLITDLVGIAEIRIGERTLPVLRTYSDVAPGELVAYVGSAGSVEIGVRDGSAAQVLQLGRGARVEAAS
jgi:S-adenosylmethionine hydrolase